MSTNTVAIPKELIADLAAVVCHAKGSSTFEGTDLLARARAILEAAKPKPRKLEGTAWMSGIYFTDGKLPNNVHDMLAGIYKSVAPVVADPVEVRYSIEEILP